MKFDWNPLHWFQHHPPIQPGDYPIPGQPGYHGPISYPNNGPGGGAPGTVTPPGNSGMTFFGMPIAPGTGASTPGTVNATTGPTGTNFSPNNSGGGGVFDPKTMAIDTTNPYARPIIELISNYLQARAARAPDKPQSFSGPMSQLYPNGVAMPKFDPVNSGSTQMRSYQPQYMNQYTANNFDPSQVAQVIARMNGGK